MLTCGEQTAALKWITMVLDLIADGGSHLSCYGVYFSLLDYESLQYARANDACKTDMLLQAVHLPHSCAHLSSRECQGVSLPPPVRSLFFIVSPFLHARFFSFRMSLSAKYGHPAELVELLFVYRSLQPQMITIELPKRKPNPPRVVRIAPRAALVGAYAACFAAPGRGLYDAFAPPAPDRDCACPRACRFRRASEEAARCAGAHRVGHQLVRGRPEQSRKQVLCRADGRHSGQQVAGAPLFMPRGSYGAPFFL